MFVLRNEALGYKEVILGFKSIYINTYNLFCIDISQEGHDSIIFRHDSFQLWESESCGFLLHNKTCDFVFLSKMGMFVTTFGSNSAATGGREGQVAQAKRVLIDDKGMERMLHSIESCNFLQLESENYIHLECQSSDHKIISVR
jgi:hypothetical protein